MKLPHNRKQTSDSHWTATDGMHIKQVVANASMAMITLFTREPDLPKAREKMVVGKKLRPFATFMASITTWA